MLTISIDDGSTNTKLSYINDIGEMQTLTIGNSWRKGFKSAALRQNKRVANYLINGNKYTYDVTSEHSLPTTHIDYQYSDLNLLAIHHALLETGLAPQPVKIICTLPITEFYNADDCQKNETNIERKKNNLLRNDVELNNGETFTIAEVEVMPESVCGVLSEILKENVSQFSRTLAVDIGGCSIDMAVIVGEFDEVAEIKGNANMGVSWVTDVAKNSLANADSDASFLVTNELIKNRHDINFVKEVVNNHAKIDEVLSSIEQRIEELANAISAECRKFCKNPNRILLIGGGATLVYEAMCQAYPALADGRIKVIENSQSILSIENMNYFNEEAA
ncbi:plasmid segregation protein ParM [Vibrio sp. SS-MA-C1-2]|uniref:plasmid segregation protein ParM domain-containing protein n=1 Tax=Vibrio sp. SS-MA-C1-2 TaxID=2908646 RepID=UPI001F1A4584|nr:plasmid segregation protein ParM domain-containing protein [Vibrio sp. SS-MA-C1-2]UJF16853.1 plasmid segregation protein ParM [Vibrio sp. SS-MA-C1-2]